MSQAYNYVKSNTINYIHNGKVEYFLVLFAFWTPSVQRSSLETVYTNTLYYYTNICAIKN